MRRALATLAKQRRRSSHSFFFADALSAPSSSSSFLPLPVSARGISQASTSASSLSPASQVRHQAAKEGREGRCFCWRKKTRSIGCLSLNLDLLNLDKTLSLPQPFYAVTVLERLPVVAPLPPTWESEYLDWMRSKGRMVEGKQMPAELGGGVGGGDGGGGKKGAAAVASALAADSEQGQQDKGKWRPAPRETEADRAGDVSSLRRRLDRRLFLVLGGTRTGGALEAFPSAEVNAARGETTRASAERALAEAVPALAPSNPASVVGAYFVGNAPAGHLRLLGGAGAGGDRGGGGTLFFHRAQLVAAGGDLLSAADSLFQVGGGGENKHAWLTREELAERLGGGELGELVKAML